jgi:hypothetical protein
MRGAPQTITTYTTMTSQQIEAIRAAANALEDQVHSHQRLLATTPHQWNAFKAGVQSLLDDKEAHLEVLKELLANTL